MIDGTKRLNFSFVIDNKLAGMAHPGWVDADYCDTLMFLKTQGIGAIVSLTQYPLDEARIHQQEFDYLHISIADYFAPTIEQTELFVQYVDKRLALIPPSGVVVHCIAGCGRTGTMLACYLVTQALSADVAIAKIRAQRPCSIESPIQLKHIHAFADWWEFEHSQLQRIPASRLR